MEQTVARFKKYTMSRNSGYDPNQAALSPSLSPKHFPLALSMMMVIPLCTLVSRAMAGAAQANSIAIHSLEISPS